MNVMVNMHDVMPYYADIEQEPICKKNMYNVFISTPE